MQHYAQTYPQLINQLRDLRYSPADLSFVREAYELAISLFSGRYQPSGKVFMAHVVGTASILASLGQTPLLVVAGLLHNVYGNGDFGDGRRGITRDRRERIRRIVGAEVEARLARFPALRWSSREADLAARDAAQLDALDRDVFAISLAEFLEHLGDLDLCYYGDRSRDYYLSRRDFVAKIARNLGFSSMAAEIQEGVDVTERSAPPITLSGQRHPYAIVFAPKSLRRRLLLAVRRKLFAQVPRWRRRLAAFAARTGLSP